MPPKRNKPSVISAPTPVDSIRHQDKRKNIPTKEFRDFMAEEEREPYEMLYPRDASLDPQLVWKGKDAQDRQDLAVPVVPIYIQEKIHPQALIENLRDTAGGGADEPEHQLYMDFNGLETDDFEKKVEFYQHDQHWSNRMILGDSLLVMTSLAEKEGLKGKVQCIYLDPPYGIKFGSNWQVSTRKRDVKDGKAEDATRQPEQIRAFRDTWKLGIHSYLAYLRDRLVVARELLTETGSVFVQIGDENVHLVRSVMDEVFGSENFLLSIVIKKKSVTTVTDPVNDFLIWYAKSKSDLRVRRLWAAKDPLAEKSRFKLAEFSDGTRKKVEECTDEELRSNETRLLNDDYPLVSQDESEGRTVPYYFQNGDRAVPGSGRHWTYDPQDGMRKLEIARRLRLATATARAIIYFDDFQQEPLSNIWEFHGDRDPVYVVQTNRGIVERCLLMSTDPGDLVLDPTCGSGTTAYVAEQWGRRWITCDTSRVALALARTRLMTAKYPYYLLADSQEGIQKEAALRSAGFQPMTGTNDSLSRAHGLEARATAGDIRKGFVYKRVPHVTLKSIANNPDIQEGMTREAIDAAIARHADQETLYDQPYPDNKRIRVTGPFTAESLSPHRVCSADLQSAYPEGRLQDDVASPERRLQTGATYPEPPLQTDVASPERRLQTGATFQDFTHIILENLRKAGVQNTRRNERLKFETLEPYAGQWIHASGTYLESGSGTSKQAEDATLKRVAVAIGPEHGTVGPEHLKEAAKEAVQGVGFDLLIVCGFAFDPHVSEEAKRYGKLIVLPTKMNPDLAMGDELLKKTGAGNLFMVFGDPDVDITNTKDGKVIVELRGLDVYDPTTGAIRSSSTEDIACWFIDTNYNGESFFVCHAYFTGADEPYEKLQRALRAEIDETAWASLYSTTSRPFARPKTGKIAVKVINHYGDEVLKVFPIL